MHRCRLHPRLPSPQSLFLSERIHHDAVDVVVVDVVVVVVALS